MTPLQLFVLLATLTAITFFFLNWSTRVAFADAVEPSMPKSIVPQRVGFILFCVFSLLFLVLSIMTATAGLAAVLARYVTSS